MPTDTAKFLLTLPREMDNTLNRLVAEGAIKSKAEYIRLLILRDLDRRAEYDALTTVAPKGTYERYDVEGIQRYIKRLEAIEQPDKIQKRTLRTVKAALRNLENKGTLTAPQRQAIFKYQLKGFVEPTSE